MSSKGPQLEFQRAKLEFQRARLEFQRARLEFQRPRLELQRAFEFLMRFETFLLFNLLYRHVVGHAAPQSITTCFRFSVMARRVPLPWAIWVPLSMGHLTCKTHKNCAFQRKRTKIVRSRRPGSVPLPPWSVDLHGDNKTWCRFLSRCPTLILCGAKFKSEFVT